MSFPRKIAYTLIEILVTITTIGGLSAGGYVVMKNLSVGSAGLKLEQDVRTVNNAIRIYLANGGKLPDSTTADEVLVKIRRQSMDLRKNAGLKGSTIDPRLNIRYQTASEAVVAAKRAYWDDVEQQFYIAPAGSQPGVKEFFIGGMPAPLPLTTDASGKIINPNLDDRQTYGTFATADSWVWDYDNNGSAPRVTPSARGTGDADTTTNGGARDDETIVLDPPLFSVPGGNYTLSWFPRTLSITPAGSTPAGVSEIYFLVSGGAWQRYSGPLQITDPGQSVSAKSVSLDLDHYMDSVEVSSTYTATPVVLDPSHTFFASAGHTFQTGYRYAELGGPLVSGSLAPVLAPVPRFYLANANDIPDYFERDTVFQAFWTMDGTSPAVPGVGRYSGISSFSNGYPGDPVTLTLATFANSNILTVKYNLLSKNTNIVTSSAVETLTTAVVTTPLLAPIVTPGDGSLSGGEKITMLVNPAGNQSPANARIYYRIDGSDPGDNNGEPNSGATLYSGPFNLDAANSPTVRVTARVYPPSAHKKWFTSSPPATLNYYLPYAEANVYGVLGSNKEIYNINPSTGSNNVFNNSAAYNLRALALDSAKARIYYLEQNGTVTSGWRLGYLDLITNNHVTLGNVRSTWAYNASAQPENLGFFNNAIYYIHAASDDLIRISLNADASGISAVTKVADLRANSDWINVGDLTVDETGLMFFVDTGRKYHRFDVASMSGYLELAGVAQYYEGLAFYKSLLFASRAGSNAIARLAPTTGASLSIVTAANDKQFVDLASPSSGTPISIAQSMWGVVDQADGPHLIEFRNNYRSPLISTAVDYGPILFEGVTLQTDVRYGILCLAISSNGRAYFVRNALIKDSVKKYDSLRPLLSLNLATLKLGDALNATHVGDLKAGLQAMAGTLDPDDVVTGLTLSPSGELFGILRERFSSGTEGADYLFKCTQPANSISGLNIGVTSIGRTTSVAGTASDSEDLVFSRDGRLFVVDEHDNELLELNPATGAVLSVASKDAGNYRGIAVDPADFRIIGSNTANNSFIQVNGGPDNDENFLSYSDRWGYSRIEAISFYQAPFLLLSNQVDLFAADGSKTIHGIDFETGQTVPVTDAPWPVRALAFDMVKREVFYLRGGSTSFTLGSFHRDTFVHKTYGDLKNILFEYRPNELPDNLMYFGGFLWYVEPKTDNLIRVELNSSSITAQKKASNLNGNSMRFDLIGDLAMTPDGWVYFSALRSDGQRFCRYQINSMSQFEVLSGPIASPVLLADGESYRENWFDALAFAPANAQGNRILYSTYSAAPSPIHTVDPANGFSTFYKTVKPSLSLIDFSDQHPGELANPGAITLQPLLRINNLQASYTYADVGGPFLTGSVPPPPASIIPTVVLNNPDELLLSHQNSNHFQVRWSTDNLSPLVSPDASVTASFTNGFPGQQLPVGFNLWNSRTTLPLKVIAKSLQTNVMTDSPLLAPAIPVQRMTLDDPILGETAAVNGIRQIEIKPNIPSGLIPPGTRIYYSTDGTVPGVARDANGLDNPTSGQLYTGTIPLPASLPAGETVFTVNARVFPPTGLPQWFAASDVNYIAIPMGLEGGHMDIDTSSQIYPYRRGRTDGHVHAYDKHYNTTGADFFNLQGGKLRNVTQNVLPGTKFKIIVANGNLSTGARIVINQVYNPSNPATFTNVTDYDNTPVSSLPVYTLNGVGGTALTSFGIYINPATSASGGLIQGNTGHVKNNTPGIYGEWRNGALTLQVVLVNSDGSDGFSVNASFSNGGVQGVATTGLLWEATLFHHGSGGPYSPN